MKFFKKQPVVANKFLKKQPVIEPVKQEDTSVTRSYNHDRSLVGRQPNPKVTMTPPVLENIYKAEVKSNGKVYTMRYHVWDNMANMYLVESTEDGGLHRVAASFELGVGLSKEQVHARIKFLMTHLPSMMETCLQRSMEAHGEHDDK